MGAMMGIQAFGSKDTYLEMTKELNRAQAKDRKAEKESVDAAERLRSLLGGLDVDQATSSSEFVPKLRRWVPFIRKGFSKFVIRRTLDSVDYAGNKIFGLPPYHVHVLVLELRDWERKTLTDITSELIDQSPVTTLAGAGKVSPSHYIFIPYDRRPGRPRTSTLQSLMCDARRASRTPVAYFYASIPYV